MRSTNEVIEFCRRYIKEESTLWLGYSGGVDSSLLLHVLAHSDLKHRLKAVHIHHGLSPYANDWQAHCEARCRAYGIALTVKHVDVRSQSESIELAARTLRYQEFSQLMSANDLLLSAHHANDQAETMLYRLVRGTGLSGLSGIKKSRPYASGILLRPLLGWSKEDLLQSAKQLGLTWVEDESNSEETYDRNFLRANILPLLETRWPKAALKIAQASHWLNEADHLLDAYAKEDLARCCPQVSKGGEAILLKELRKVSALRQKHIIRYWCKNTFDFVPHAAQLDKLTEVLDAKIDASPQLNWAGHQVRRFNDRLYILRAANTGASRLTPQSPIHWDSARDLDLGDGFYLACELGQASEAAGSTPSLQPFTFKVAFRQGGERCKPLQRQHSQSLKKLLQEYTLEPWLRDKVPLIYYQETLIAVGDVFLCESELLRQHPNLGFKWWYEDGNHRKKGSYDP